MTTPNPFDLPALAALLSDLPAGRPYEYRAPRRELEYPAYVPNGRGGSERARRPDGGLEPFGFSVYAPESYPGVTVRFTARVFSYEEDGELIELAGRVFGFARNPGSDEYYEVRLPLPVEPAYVARVIRDTLDALAATLSDLRAEDPETIARYREDY